MVAKQDYFLQTTDRESGVNAFFTPQMPKYKSHVLTKSPKTLDSRRLPAL
jgi:hypothetical protein